MFENFTRILGISLELQAFAIIGDIKKLLYMDQIQARSEDFKRGGGLSSFCAWLQTVSGKLKPTGGSEDFTSSSLHDYPMLRIGFQPQPNVSNTKSNLINLIELDASGRWQVTGYASKTWNDHSKYIDSHQSSKLIWWKKRRGGRGKLALEMKNINNFVMLYSQGYKE